MQVGRIKTEKWHNYEEGDCRSPIKQGSYYKKGFWKRRDRKRFLRNIKKWFGKDE